MVKQTAASRALRVDQKRYPPWRNGRSKTLQDILLRYLPAEPLALLTSGKCVLGEIGVAEPNAQTVGPLHDGTYYIELTSGFMDGVYAVCRPIAATTTRAFTGASIEPTLSSEQAVEELAIVLQEWAAKTLWDHNKLRSPRFSLHSEQGYWAEALATNIELFALAHEVAHALLPSDTRELPPMQSVRPEEIIADHFALNVMVTAGAERGYPNCFAASVFYLRLLDALESVGFSQPPDYPTPTERREALEMAMSGIFVQDAVAFRKVHEIIAMHEPFLVGAVAAINRSRAAQDEAVRDQLVMSLFPVIDQLASGFYPNAETVKRLQESHSDMQHSVIDIVCTMYLTDVDEATAKKNRMAFSKLADLLSGSPRIVLLERIQLLSRI